MKKTKMLKKNYEFRNVLSKGQGYFDKNLKVYIIKNHQNVNMLGLAVSTKVRTCCSKKQNKKNFKRML